MAEGEDNRERVRADAVLLLCTAVWGGTFVVVKDSLSQADPFAFLAVRFAIGAAAMALVARRALFDRRSVRYGLVLGVLLFLGFAFQTVGLTGTTPSRSAFITGLSVLLVPFVAVLLYRRIPRVPSIAGIALAVIGLYWLTLSGAERAAGSTARGDLLTLACTVAYAFHIASNESFSRRGKAAAMVAVQLAVVSVLSAACMPFFGARIEWDGLLLWGVGFTGIAASAGAILGQTWAQARTTAVRAALIFALEPVFAAIYSVMSGRERLGMREIVGGGLIVLGVIVGEGGAALWDARARRDAASGAGPGRAG
jgi:drug/metabolite transporter (DMT)-like permease